MATLAVNCCVADGFKVAVAGDIETDAGAVMVIVAVAFFAVLETEVAVKVTVAGLGTVAGAEYVTGVPDALVAADNVPQALPVQPVPESVQRTPRFRQSCLTTAVKDWVPLPACTLALVGDTLTVIRDCAWLLGTHKKIASE